MKVELPFLPEFEERMLDGRKTWTTRSRKHGKPGDTFDAFGHAFEIFRVEPMKLGQVASLGHKKEGFGSAAEFIECWDRIHPGRRYRPADVKFVHKFRLVGKRMGG